MSFTGDLEHLPIVDVIQLLNTSRKSGILSIKGKRGESQLVFKDGYIVSASHLNNSIRIGQILVDMELISQEQLETGLRKQQTDGSRRKPLVITLIELGLVREEDAYKGLQKLIETTLVEILTWKTGKFTLEALAHSISCEFRYYPEKMNHEVNLNTQSILMDALRIFDEKMRDGLIEDESCAGEAVNDGFDDAFSELLSEDVLGLAEIDHLSARLPKAFSGAAPFDPLETERSRIGELAPHLSPADRDRIASFLAQHGRGGQQGANDPQQGQLILLTSDKLLGHSLTAVCGSANIGVTVVATASAAEAAMADSATGGRRPFLTIDPPAPGADGQTQPQGAEIWAILRGKHPDSIRIQLAEAGDQRLALQAYRAGARAVIPRPAANGASPTFADDFIALLEIIPAYLLGC